MDKAEVTFSALNGILEKEKFVLQSELKVSIMFKKNKRDI